MGKKSLQVSSKKISSSTTTTTTTTTKDDKKQLSSLLKVLRPKVYITDSSSFKNLVQHLTGNGNDPIIPIPISSSPHPPLPFPPLDHHQDYQDHHHHHHQFFQGSSTSMELSSVGDSPQLSMPTSFAGLESSPEQSIPAPASDDLSSSFANHAVDFSQFRDIESWLLEVDQFPNYYYDHGYVDPSVAHQEACVYDYGYDYNNL